MSGLFRGRYRRAAALVALFLAGLLVGVLLQVTGATSNGPKPFGHTCPGNSCHTTSTTNTTTTTTQPTTTTTTADIPYYVESFDGAYTQPFWKSSFGGPGSLSWATGYSGQAQRITLDGVTTVGASWGQAGAVFADAPYAYAGESQNTGTGNGTPEDTWYRFRLHFPADYAATSGSQNDVFEFHVDGLTSQNAASVGQTAYSTWLGVASDGACFGSPPLCTSSGANPRLQLHTVGGSVAAPIERYWPLPWTLQLDHWYDVVLHVYWSADPSVGHIQLWVDGAPQVDALTPTLYVRTDGTFSYGQSIGFYDYRLWATWSSSIDFDELVVGPTQASVGA